MPETSKDRSLDLALLARVPKRHFSQLDAGSGNFAPPFLPTHPSPHQAVDQASPAGTHIALPDIARGHYLQRAEAVRDAVRIGVQMAPAALFDATGFEFHEMIKGFVPGMLLALIVVAIPSVGLGLVLGVLGSFAGPEIGAPLAVAGVQEGFAFGVWILGELGLAFLVAYILSSTTLAMGGGLSAVRLAWNSVDTPDTTPKLIVQAGHDLAGSVALFWRGVLQGLAAYLLSKGSAAAASRVPELVEQLRTSKLGSGFADWVEANWQRLIEDQRLKINSETESGGGSGRDATELTQTQDQPGKGHGPPKPESSKSTSKSTDPETKFSGQGAENPNRCTGGEPVDVITGEVISWATDFTLPASLPLSFKRSYISSQHHAGCLGPGWSCNWGQSVDLQGDTATYHGGDGSFVVFRLPLQWNGDWLANLEVAKTRLRRVTSGFEVATPDRQTLRFEISVGHRWLLSEISDPNGNWIRFSYSKTGAMQQVSHKGGYRLAIEATPTRLHRVSLLDSEAEPIELIRFRFDSRGRLSEVIDRTGLPLRYQYDHAGRLARWDDRKGTWCEYHYDTQGRCVHTFGPNGMYDYQFQYEELRRTNTVTDSLGHRTIYVYNKRQQPILKQDARGFVTRTLWNDQSQKIDVRDAAGRGSQTQYDADGNPASVRDALGRTTTIRYNKLGLPDAITDAAGSIWSRVYDDRGNLIEAHGPDGAVWRYEHDDAGNVTRTVDPAGYSRSFGYNPHGLLTWFTDAKGNQTTILRDALGRTIERTDALARTTRYSYNAQGKLSEAALADETSLHWEYDVEGNLTRRIGPDGHAYSYRYGAFDLLEEVTKPSGGKLLLFYDTEARLNRVQNELGQSWSYGYNATGQVIQEIDFHGRTQQFDYDASGLCILRVNGLGEETVLDRDAVGQLIASRGGEELRFEYDALGRVFRGLNGDVEVATKHDVYGRVLREVQDGRTVESIYDARGLRVKRSVGERDCEWVFDENACPIRLKMAGDEIEFDYDAGGRQVERRMPGEVTLRQEFDVLDRLTSQSAGHSGFTNVQSHALVNRQYRYNKSGYPVEIQDARQGLTRYGYDADGRIATAECEHRVSEQFSYDLAGYIVDAYKWGPYGEKPVSVIGSTTRFYAKNGRLERIGETEYFWDADGRLTEKRSPSARWRYEWTPEGRLRKLHTPDGKRLKYEYDAFGRRVRKQGREQGADFVWDGVVLAAELRNGGNSSEWVYEPDTFKLLLKREGGETYQCITDQVGTARELLGEDGKVVWTATLGTWGESEGDLRTSCGARFPGQWLDAESGLHYNYHRYYDPEIGQYISSDPIGLSGGTRSYGYVHNPTSWVDPLGLQSCQFGDLTREEISQIQKIVDETGRPLEVVGSAAKGTRRGIGTELPTGKGSGTRSDIDYMIPHSSVGYYKGYEGNLPSIDPGGPIYGVHNPHMGPAVRFEPGAAPRYIPSQ